MVGTIESEKMREVATAYLAFLQTDAYEKIEKISDQCVHTFSTSRSRSLVLCVRKFMGFGESLPEKVGQKNWYKKNNIEKLTFDARKKRFGGEFLPNQHQRAGNRWIDWFLDEHRKCKIENGDNQKFDLWFFSAGVKSLKEIELKLAVLKQGSVKLDNEETSGDLYGKAQLLLESNEFKKLKDSVKNLWPETLAANYSVLKYTRTSGGWSKEIGATSLSKLNGTFNGELSDNEIAVQALSDDILNAFGEAINTYDGILKDASDRQMTALAGSDALTSKTKLDDKGRTIAKDIKLLAIVKTSVLNERRYMLRDLNNFQKNSQITLASVKLSASVTEGSLNIIGGVVSIANDGLGKLFKDIGGAAAKIQSSAAELPVSLSKARIDFLELEVSRLITLLDTLIDNYKLVLEIDK